MHLAAMVGLVGVLGSASRVPGAFRYMAGEEVARPAANISSAIMFATIVNDNKMATLIGQSPRDGHPTHFGELYSTRTPNTQLPMRFGVKEWIRPAGKDKENRLTPAITMPVTVPLNVQDIISRVNSLQAVK